MTASPHPVSALRPDMRPVLPATAAAPLRLGFLSPHNPYDRTSFSGTAHHAARALAAHPGIVLRILGPHRPRTAFDRLVRRFPDRPDPARLDLAGLDAVVGLVATPLLDALPPGLPFLHVTDATPGFLREAYGWDIPAEADAAEARVAARALRVVYTSRIMARRAPAELGLARLSPASLPFGVNFDRLPDGLPAKSAPAPARLLFVGIDWARKGGDIAVAALDILRAGGCDARLTVVGRLPDRLRGHPGIDVAGFLDKNRPRALARLSQLYAEAHLLLLPSRADCTPMVIAEAMAHGTPVVAAETGGVAELLGGAGTGLLLPAAAGPGDWATAVRGILADPARLAMMSEAAFDRASTRLNWAAWAAGIAGLLGAAGEGSARADAA